MEGVLAFIVFTLISSIFVYVVIVMPLMTAPFTQLSCVLASPHPLNAWITLTAVSVGLLITVLALVEMVISYIGVFDEAKRDAYRAKSMMTTGIIWIFCAVFFFVIAVAGFGMMASAGCENGDIASMMGADVLKPVFAWNDTDEEFVSADRSVMDVSLNEVARGIVRVSDDAFLLETGRLVETISVAVLQWGGLIIVPMVLSRLSGFGTGEDLGSILKQFSDEDQSRFGSVLENWDIDAAIESISQLDTITKSENMSLSVAGVLIGGAMLHSAGIALQDVNAQHEEGVSLFSAVPAALDARREAWGEVVAGLDDRGFFKGLLNATQLEQYNVMVEAFNRLYNASAIASVASYNAVNFIKEDLNTIGDVRNSVVDLVDLMGLEDVVNVTVSTPSPGFVHMVNTLFLKPYYYQLFMWGMGLTLLLAVIAGFIGTTKIILATREGSTRVQTYELMQGRKKKERLYK